MNRTEAYEFLQKLSRQFYYGDVESVSVTIYHTLAHAETINLGDPVPLQTRVNSHLAAISAAVENPDSPQNLTTKAP